MGMREFRLFAVVTTLFLVSALGVGRSAAQTTDCDKALAANTPTVSTAYNNNNESNPGAPEARNISLGDIVVIKGANFASLFDKACANRNVVLFLNDWPITDVTPLPPVDPSKNILKFKLVNRHLTEEGKSDAWLPILGSPTFLAVSVKPSLGFSNGFAMGPTAGSVLPELHLHVLPTCWFLLWAVIFFGMIILFFKIARNSCAVRDPAPSAPGAIGPYSLSRSQGVWWFFIIIAAYLFIGIITGDFSNSVNSTALILLGIGAGTVIGSATIDAQKDTAKDKADTLAAITKVKAQIADSEAAMKTIDDDIKANPNMAEADRLKKQSSYADQKAAKADLESQLTKLQGQSEGFLTDILSDANGISFHRFQMAVWTVVLGIIFISEVYHKLAMPTFNTTLMGMLGLSAGTYLGLKIPEATTPTKQSSATTAT